MTSISSCACARVTPGLKRATGIIPWSERFAYFALSGLTGFQTSVAIPSVLGAYHGANPLNPGGITPTTVETTPSIRNALPSTPGSLLNLFFQKELLITTV